MQCSPTIATLTAPPTLSAMLGSSTTSAPTDTRTGSVKRENLGRLCQTAAKQAPRPRDSCRRPHRLPTAASRLLSGRGSVVRDETMLPRAARPPPPASRCVLTAFFLLHSSRDRSSQPASAAAADPARKQIPRAASGTADPWSGWRGGAPEGWSRPSVAGTIRAWTAPLRAKWSTGRRDWINLFFFYLVREGQASVVLLSRPSRQKLQLCPDSRVCVWLPRKMGLGPRRPDLWIGSSLDGLEPGCWIYESMLEIGWVWKGVILSPDLASRLFLCRRRCRRNCSRGRGKKVCGSLGSWGVSSSPAFFPC